jgi:hypothetical protein
MCAKPFCKTKTRLASLRKKGDRGEFVVRTLAVLCVTPRMSEEAPKLLLMQTLVGSEEFRGTETIPLVEAPEANVSLQLREQLKQDVGIQDANQDVSADRDSACPTTIGITI